MGKIVCSNDFSRCQECHGVRHDTYPEQLKRLFGDWRLILHWGVTWRMPSNAETTEVVTTNNPSHPPHPPHPPHPSPPPHLPPIPSPLYDERKTP
ncbi:hypothetical protein [Laspinema palackyanum]|uniref:hypothetical protein n=1 Tax=Laspinema palackyanum TaxID=3231601 RepID=UPI00345D8462|nr:hypothetical protein [Laspinema sp. D2c]